jgi:tetratricopeptide (TPR) repeat protein
VPKPPAIPPKPPGATPTVDLADLPAPKRNSALAGTEPSKPASKSGLGGAELPAPKGVKPPAAAPGALDLDDLMPVDLPAPKASTAGLADLPAPKRQSALGDAPASKPVPSALADLPAPKAKPSALADLPAPKAKPSALADLPAPKAKSGGLDLDLPAPKKGGLDLDLPAPKKGGLDLDLPAPKHSAAGGGLDVGLSLDGDLDLPAPKAGGISDLPAPKPGANNDLPAPKGFFDDLPQPAKKAGGTGGVDLPAPKGFFDDLPQPAAASSKSTDLAPKQQGGFFDDLPAPVKPGAGAAKGGFFDDLPQPAKGGKAAAGAKPGSAGLFDDLEQPGGGGPDEIQLAAGDIDLGPVGADRPLELESGGSDLDLGLALGGDQSFTDLDLSEPTTGRKPAGPPEEEASPIKIKTPGKGGKPSTPIAITVKKDGPTEIKLDLADDPHAKSGGAAAVSTTTGAAAKQKPKKVERSPEQIAEEAAKKQKRTRVVLASVLGIALLGSGGFYFYKKHTDEQARNDKIAEQIGIARKQLAESAPQHWQRASAAAQDVLTLAPNNGVALGLAAEAALAGALDNGVNFDNRVKTGRNLAQQGLGAGKSGPELERAQALMHIAARDPDRALKILQKLVAKTPKDGWLQLYLGWAQLEKGDAEAALKAFDAAIASAPGAKAPALYGQGQAKLLEADIEGARAAFAAVLQIPTSKDHIGAQIGLAATLPPQQTAQKEADLLAVLQRDEVKSGKADPRAVVTAYDLAADIARTSGRLDIARERYRKAIALSKLDIPAHVGLAKVELKDDKIQVAGDLIAKALVADANNAEVQLLAAELDIVGGKLPDAQSKLEKLDARTPPLTPLLAARLHVLKGRLLEAQGKDEEAITEYTEGAKLAGELDLTPTMAAATKLAELAKKETDPAKAAGLRKRADDLLSALAERAKEDGELSLTLGIAYLQAGDAVKAEDSLRRATTLREKDPEAKLQLARALSALGRVDDAIAQLKGALALDPKRQDVALELARTYQVNGRDTEAMQAYDKLLADPATPLVARAKAGRYYATRGERQKAAEQAEAILAVEPENAAGLYLKGEGLMLGKKWDEARSVLTKASDADPDAQYFDALGRAFEGSLAQSGDTKYVESARYAYERAAKTDPKLFHAQLGLGHMLVESGKWEEAIKALKEASALDKSSSEVMYWMGLAFFGVRNQSPAHRKTAADWLESAMKAQPHLPTELKAEAYWRLGQLYVDLNKAGDAARTMEAATHMGEELEKNTGTSPVWLTELYYDLGDMYYKLNNKSAQKHAWQRYVDRKPRPSVRLKEAQQALLTDLQRF